MLNKPTSSRLITELTMLEEKVKQSQIRLASEQEAYDNVSWAILATEIIMLKYM